MRILRGAGQSASSLQRKLERRGYTTDAAGEAVRRCADTGYINDAVMAASVAARHRPLHRDPPLCRAGRAGKESQVRGSTPGG